MSPASCSTSPCARRRNRPQARSAWASTSPDIRTVVHAGVPASIDDYYQEIGRGGRDGRSATAVLVHDPRTIRIPRLLAARTHLGEDTFHRVVDVVENGRTAVADIAESADVPTHAVDRVVNELAELGFVTIAGSGHRRTVHPVRELPPPADLTQQLASLADRRQAVLGSRLDAARGYAEHPLPQSGTARLLRRGLHTALRQLRQRPDSNDVGPRPGRRLTLTLTSGILTRPS